MGQIALSTIKTQVQSVLDTANTTTASPLDLSSNLAKRVQQVLQINVERIPIQPDFYPCVTMFYDSKSVNLQDMASSMVLGKRKADVDLKIVGIVWNDDINTSNFQYKDLSDNECEQLMENVEQVLRNDPTFSNNVLWSKTTEVSYHTYSVSEGSNMRAGIMNFRLTVMY